MKQYLYLSLIWVGTIYQIYSMDKPNVHENQDNKRTSSSLSMDTIKQILEQKKIQRTRKKKTPPPQQAANQDNILSPFSSSPTTPPN